MPRPDGTHEPRRVRQPLLPRRWLRPSEIGRALGGLVIWLLVALSLPATFLGWVHVVADVFGPTSDGVLAFEARLCATWARGFEVPGFYGPLFATVAAVWMPVGFRQSAVLRRLLLASAGLAWAFPAYALWSALLQDMP